MPLSGNRNGIAGGLSCLSKALITADTFSYFRGHLSMKTKKKPLHYIICCEACPPFLLKAHSKCSANPSTTCPLQWKECCGRLMWSDRFWGTRYLTQNTALWDPFHSQLSSRPQPSMEHVPITRLKYGNSFSLSVLPAWHLFQHSSGYLKKEYIMVTPVYVNALNFTPLLKKTEGQCICCP